MAKANQNTISKRGPLGELVVNIEFIIISIVQGAAVTTLAAQAAGLIESGAWEYWPYVITGFLFAMFYWAEAIGHTIGFIDWPLSLPHTFLYFGVGFLEVVAFLNVTNPIVWFGTFFVLTILGIILYIVDFKIICEQEDQIAVSERGEKFFADLVSDQKRGLYILTPMALVYNLVAVLLIHYQPETFLTGGWHLLLVSLQLVMTLGVVALSVKTFKNRGEVIAELYGTYADKLKK